MNIKNISILGSTGSIGTQALEVIRENHIAKVLALTTNNNIDLLEKQVEEFRPRFAVVMNDDYALQLDHRLKQKNIKTEILSGLDGLVNVSTLNDIDIVLNSLVGNIGLKPTIEAIKHKKDIALANKETLVSAGELVMKLVKENNVQVLPVDSEHSAIFQCLQGNKHNNIQKIHLTASGGPFRTFNFEQLNTITKDQALNHPNWSMGPKITIDSATMMNKGLEVIEAKWLFNVEVKQINVLVHPQSIIHSMVEFDDGSVVAQLGEPDMRLPIQYALTYPNRLKNNFSKIDFLLRNNLTFEEPDLKKFQCLQLAFEAIEISGTMPAVMNAANEIAVDRFLKNNISFLDITRIIDKTMSAYNVKKEYALNDIFEADLWAREYATNLIL